MPSAFPSPLAQRLHDTRELGEIAASDLSELAGLALAYVGHVERGTLKKPGLDAIAAVARVLGVKLDFLVDGLGPKPTARKVQAAIVAARAAAAGGRGETQKAAKRSNPARTGTQ